MGARRDCEPISKEGKPFPYGGVPDVVRRTAEKRGTF